MRLSVTFRIYLLLNRTPNQPILAIRTNYLMLKFVLGNNSNGSAFIKECPFSFITVSSLSCLSQQSHPWCNFPLRNINAECFCSSGYCIVTLGALTMSDRLSSAVWKRFAIDPNNDLRAVCNLCNDSVSPGTIKSKTTSNMREHLRRKHEQTFSKDEEESKSKKKKTTSSPSVGYVNLTGGNRNAELQRQISIKVSL